MFDRIKPGHVLRFTTCPHSILSPGKNPVDNSLETEWTGTNTLGRVECFSHPSGQIGRIAAAVAREFRQERSRDYSPLAHAFSFARIIGSEECDFVGYNDGFSNYTQTARTVFSKDFSGCLMVDYTINGHRRVAHVAASNVQKNDCKQAFLNTIRENGAILNGWFKPFIESDDLDRKLDDAIILMDQSKSKKRKPYRLGNRDHNLVTFGIVTSAGTAYAIDAYKPLEIGGNYWVITHVANKTMSTSWIVP